MIRASVIVPTHNRAQYLKDTIDSLCCQHLDDDFELIVVDNAPATELKLLVASLASRCEQSVRYVAEPRTGLHNARHSGAMASVGDILVYVDDDVLVEPGWLRALLIPYTDKNVACVGGKVLPRWEDEEPAWPLRLGYHSLLDFGSRNRELSAHEYLSGCNFSIRKTVLFEVGGFNPDGFGDRNLILYRGDGEYGLLRKVREVGYRVVYTPDAILHHRMPSERVGATYLQRRAFDLGIEHSYSYFRYTRPSFARLLVRLAYLITKHIRYRIPEIISRLGRRPPRIDDLLTGSNTRGQLVHTFCLLYRADLRKHCVRESYLAPEVRN